MERIGKILETKQPDVCKNFNKKKKRKRKRRKRRGANNEHLSFEFIDRLMRERTSVNESKCRGR